MAGNPYFVKQFFSSLHRDPFVQYSNENREFTWDMSSVHEQAKKSDNVVDLMVKTIEAMSYHTQIILILASAMGPTFKSVVLSPLLANFDQAQELYNKAIEGFAKGQMFLMEAIAHERLVCE